MLPHLAEEAWAVLPTSQRTTPMIADAAWPAADPALLVDDEVTIAIQMAGKLRDTTTIAKGLARQAVEPAALARPRLAEPHPGARRTGVLVGPVRTERRGGGTW